MRLNEEQEEALLLFINDALNDGTIDDDDMVDIFEANGYDASDVQDIIDISENI